VNNTRLFTVNSTSTWCQS